MYAYCGERSQCTWWLSGEFSFSNIKYYILTIHMYVVTYACLGGNSLVPAAYHRSFLLGQVHLHTIPRGQGTCVESHS